VVLAAVIAVAAVLLVGFALFGGGGGGQGGYTCESRLAQSSAGPDGVVTADEGNAHVAPGSRLRYAQCPPASGPHYNAAGSGPLPARFYGPESEQSPGGWVHNLEHGYVVILYSCGADGTTCPSEEEEVALVRFQNTAPTTPGADLCGIKSEVLTARFDAMDARFAFVAWDRVALSDTFDPVAAARFALRWIDQPTLPEAARC
jgi:hypothetical protein